jgi:hypothetical protein
MLRSSSTSGKIVCEWAQRDVRYGRVDDEAWYDGTGSSSASGTATSSAVMSIVNLGADTVEAPLDCARARISFSLSPFGTCLTSFPDVGDNVDTVRDAFLDRLAKGLLDRQLTVGVCGSAAIPIDSSSCTNSTSIGFRISGMARIASSFPKSFSRVRAVTWKVSVFQRRWHTPLVRIQKNRR